MTNDKIDSIPQKLQDYLVEQASECADITMTVLCGLFALIILMIGW